MQIPKRRAFAVFTASALLLTVTPTLSEAAVVIDTCNSTGTHCYAIRTQGDVEPPSLSNVTSLTAWVRADCQHTPDPTSDFATAEIWLGTPRRTTANEWVETGITTGTFENVGTVDLSYFWAREYYSSTTNSMIYNEYQLTDAQPSTGTNYVVSLAYVSGSGWRIYHGSNQVGGGSANAAPGSGQFIEAGAESTGPEVGNSGVISHLSRVQNGTTYSGLTGDLAYASNAYNYSTASTADIHFWSNASTAGYCRTSTAAAATESAQAFAASTVTSTTSTQTTTATALTSARSASAPDSATASTLGDALSTRHRGVACSAGYAATTVADFERANPDERGTLSSQVPSSDRLLVVKVHGKFGAPAPTRPGERSTAFDTAVTVWDATRNITLENSYFVDPAPDLTGAAKGSTATYDLRSLGKVQPVDLPG